MARAFRGNHDDVQILAWHDLVVMDIETMSKSQRSTFLEVVGYFIMEYFSHILIRQQDHHNICILDCITNLGNLVSGLFRFGPGAAFFTQANSDIDAGVFEVLRMGMALGAITDDS